MKKIAITTPDYFPNEAEQIVQLLEGGLQCLHLRKPGSSLADYENLIQQIPAQYHNRMVLHEHFSLLDKFNGKGIHLNRRNPVPYKKQGITLSKSCHTISELHNIDGFDYVFLSPVFDSISKVGYRSAFSDEVLRKAADEGLINEKVIALGGVTDENMKDLEKYNFGGAAMLGAAWERAKNISPLQNFSFQFITHTNEKYNYLQSAELALAGGCRWVQLRMKDAPLHEVEKTALKLREMCREAGATFIIDDHVALAKKVGADGVHIGKTDMPPEEARAILGKDFIIGGTANTFEDIKRLAAAGVDYVGLGPFRFTQTKKNLSSVLGLEGYEKIIKQCRAANINLPVVAIGGITTADIRAIMNTGVCGIAVSGSILGAREPVEETKEIIRILDLQIK